MNVYLAARYSSKERMQTVALQLISRGFHITSSWVYSADRPEQSQMSPDFREGRAVIDYEDVEISDILVLDLLDGPGTRGAQWAELGIALGRNLKVMVIGETENIFAYHPKARIYTDWEACIRDLVSYKQLIGA